ncbi:hypothetical protein LZK73_11235 [Neorhizobium galegae]|nr:hypothetical protein LZK73_11235 [Neorhizobium galegae]
MTLAGFLLLTARTLLRRRLGCRTLGLRSLARCCFARSSLTRGGFRLGLALALRLFLLLGLGRCLRPFGLRSLLLLLLRLAARTPLAFLPFRRDDDLLLDFDDARHLGRLNGGSRLHSGFQGDGTGRLKHQRQRHERCCDTGEQSEFFRHGHFLF